MIYDSCACEVMKSKMNWSKFLTDLVYIRIELQISFCLAYCVESVKYLHQVVQSRINEIEQEEK